jgi:hypothetical protein
MRYENGRRPYHLRHRRRAPALDPHEFIRRFLMHVLPQGFHRIRYYGFLTSQSGARNVANIRELLAAPLIPVDAIKALDPTPEEPKAAEHPCPWCGGPHAHHRDRFAHPDLVH